jgi:hypothetical protein
MWALVDYKVDTVTLSTVSRELSESTMFEKAYKDAAADDGLGVTQALPWPCWHGVGRHKCDHTLVR